MRNHGNTKYSASPDFKYGAFISYSHFDQKWATWLQRALEKYKVPNSIQNKTRKDDEPISLFPIFCDRTDLPSSPSIRAKIEEALKGSRNLIVICSPSAASSPYVDKEIQIFKKIHGQKRIFCLIVDGEPHYSSKTIIQQRGCIPPSLLHQGNQDQVLSPSISEPIAADARKGKDGKNIAFLKIVSGLLEVSLDDLLQRDHRRRRNTHLLQMSISLLFSIVALSSYIGLSDAGYELPGSQRIRFRIDKSEASIFRPIPDIKLVREAAHKMRGKLILGLKNTQGERGLFHHLLNKDGNVYNTP